jgi:hypothetical protein
MQQLGLAVIGCNEEGRRRVDVPTLFYLPHCEVGPCGGPVVVLCVVCDSPPQACAAHTRCSAGLSLATKGTAPLGPCHCAHLQQCASPQVFWVSLALT